MNRGIIVGLLGAWVLLGGGPGSAASLVSDPAALLAPGAASPSSGTTPPPHSTEADPVVLRQLLGAVRAEQERGSQSSAPPPGATQDEVLERVHLRDELAGALERHLDVLERLPDARRRLAEQEARTKDWVSFPSPPPYSILLADQLRESSDTARIEANAAGTRGNLVTQLSEDYAKRLKAAEIDARQSEERLAQASTGEQRDRQIWLRDLSRLRARAAAAVIAESQADKVLFRLEAAEQRSLAALLTRQLDVVRKARRFTKADLDGVLANLDQRQAVLEERGARLKGAGSRSRQSLIEAQNQLATARAGHPRDEEGADERATRLRRLERLVALCRRQADNDDLAYDMTRRMIEISGWERIGWQLRWQLVNSSDHEKLGEALTKIDGLMEILESWDQYIQGETLRAERRDDDADAPPRRSPSPEDTALGEEFRAAQRERVDILRGGQRAVSGLLRTLGLWRQDFLSHDADRSAMSVARDWWSDVRRAMTAMWSFELFSAEDSLEIDGQRVTAVRSVTIGKSLGVVLLVLFGSMLSAQGLKGLRHMAVRQLGVSSNLATTVSRWLHFVLVSALVIAALYLANIPLTVFAFLGGAFAIGIGFGTQVVLKNLISGVMLLLERPLRVGDIIEVGSVVGTVTNINIRSSTVRTSDGIEILVPNSTFIENNVTNWTYSNPRVRRTVSVGVDYTASPKKVSEILMETATRHPSVLEDPQPRVLLDNFGSEAIHFTLRYWIDFGSGADGSLIASELRFMIAEALAEAGIPFPQRVVHLHTAAASPLPRAPEEAG